MTQEEIQQIFNFDETHKFIFNHLDDNTLGIVAEILSVVDSQDFREFNPNAQFDLTDVPIPYQQLSRNAENNGLAMTEDVKAEVDKLLLDINKAGTNKEYPYVFCGFADDKEGYCAMRKMASGDGQTCQYDWQWIEKFVKENECMNIALFHTHPKPIDIQQNTLFNKYPEQLSELGVKSEGLNLSLSDLYAQMYLDNLIARNNPSLTSQSIVLMHTGNLVAFSTQNGVNLDCHQKLEQNKNAQEEFVM